MGEMTRIHILLPRNVVARIDARVGPRRRSEFIAATLRKELDRQRRVGLMAAALAEARIAPDAHGPPDWATSESTRAWVRAHRHIGERDQSDHSRSPSPSQ
jgi:Arc/MetJ-type ribon-helix-helix transcriptional regulator